MCTVLIICITISNFTLLPIQPKYIHISSVEMKEQWIVNKMEPLQYLVNTYACTVYNLTVGYWPFSNQYTTLAAQNSYYLAISTVQVLKINIL